MTMGEGNTPLVPSARIAPGQLSFKLEMCNPTGSYKDRFVVRELSRIIESGARSVVASSSGNTGASLAACCARAGLRCLITASPDTPSGKLSQMRAHGATVVRIPGFTVDAGVTAAALNALREFAAETGTPFIISAFQYCPHGMEGVGAIADELLPHDPAHVFVPIGSGGLYSAVAGGFRRAGRSTKVHAVQPAGCGTVADAWRLGERRAAVVSGSTVIGGLSLPLDIDATRALGMLYENGGTAIAVTDEEIFAAQRRLLAEEGIFCEPAGAAALAGWLRSPLPDSVCLVTGHGGKDPASIHDAAEAFPSPLVEAAGLADWLRRA